MKKPISPKLHAILDYGVAGMLATLPAAFKLEKSAIKAYAGVATNILTVNSLTDTPFGLSNVMSMKTHQKMDVATLSSLAMMSFAKPFRKDKKALCFHLALLAMVATQYVLTDFDAKQI